MIDFKTLFSKKGESLDALLQSYRTIEKRMGNIEKEKFIILDKALLSGDLDNATIEAKELDVELQLCNRGLERLKFLMVDFLKSENAKSYQSAEKKMNDLDAKRSEAAIEAGSLLGQAVAAVDGYGSTFSQKLSAGIRKTFLGSQKGIKPSDFEEIEAAYIREQNRHGGKISDYKAAREALYQSKTREPGSAAELNFAQVTVAKLLDPSYKNFGIVDVGKIFPPTMEGGADG